MKHTKHLWNEQPAYKKWVKARDRALEQLHHRAQIEASDVMRKVFSDTLMIAKASYPQMKDGQSVDSFEYYLKSIFNVAVTQLYQVLVALRSRSYTLSKSSEAEIIARMSHGKHVVANIRGDFNFHTRVVEPKSFDLDDRERVVGHEYEEVCSVVSLVGEF